MEGFWLCVIPGFQKKQVDAMLVKVIVRVLFARPLTQL